MDARKPIQFNAVPDGDLKCRSQVQDVHDKKVPGCIFKLEINKAEIKSVATIERYCDGNPFKMILKDPATDQQISFHVKNKNDFDCDSRETEGGKIMVYFVSLPVTVARREVSSTDLLWDILQASKIQVNMEPAQLPLPGLEEGDEPESDEDGLDDESEKPGKKSGKGRK